MTGGLIGRTALVTGSDRGMGLTIARTLAAEGANLVLNGLLSRGDGAALAAQIESDTGSDVIHIRADVGEAEEVERLIAEASSRFGGVDVLVNNAVVRHFAPLEEFPPEAWDRSLRVNLSSAFHCARLCVPHMKRQTWGRIINMSSYYGWRGAENRIDYVTTKTALIGLTRGIAIETAKSGITCNAVCPGSVGTEAIREKIRGMAADQGVDYDDLAARYAAERSATGHFVSEESIAATIVFLCSAAGADMTGSVLPVDGGWLAS